MNDFIIQQINENYKIKQLLLENNEYIEQIKAITNTIIHAYQSENKIMICGNGGSAADAQHMAAELVSKFRFDRKALPAIALTTNSSILTSIGNDFDYNNIFERQVEAFGNQGDILIGISTSGNSKNITKAFKKAKGLGVISIALLGKDGGENKQYADMSLILPSNDTPRIQESHIMIIHIICDLVEKTLFSDFTYE